VYTWVTGAAEEWVREAAEEYPELGRQIAEEYADLEYESYERVVHRCYIRCVLVANVVVACPHLARIFRAAACTIAHHLVTLLQLAQDSHIRRTVKCGWNDICDVNHPARLAKFLHADVSLVE